MPENAAFDISSNTYHVIKVNHCGFFQRYQFLVHVSNSNLLQIKERYLRSTGLRLLLLVIERSNSCWPHAVKCSPRTVQYMNGGSGT